MKLRNTIQRMNENITQKRIIQRTLNHPFFGGDDGPIPTILTILPNRFVHDS
jgi:hypothetical protein